MGFIIDEIKSHKSDLIWIILIHWHGVTFQNTMEGKMQQAQDWLADPSALIGSAGELYNTSRWQTTGD